MSQTVGHQLAAALRTVGLAYAPGDQVAPCAVLWADPDRLWSDVVSALFPLLPELYQLGAYDPQRRSGWLAAAAGAADKAHPTRAGLRIGKKLPDLPGGEASTAADEWHRDGQVRNRQPTLEPMSQPASSS